jgi:LacI family transcriptional regulator
MSSIRYSLENTSFDAIITFPTNTISGEDNIRKLVKRRKVDGLLLVIPGIEQETMDFCRERNIPTVILHFKQVRIDTKHVDYIYTDHECGGYYAANHLIKGGRRRIITLTEDRNLYEYAERTAGYRRALDEHNLECIPEWIVEGKCSVEFGYTFAKNNRELFRTIDAVFAQSDFIAVGVIEALKELEIAVPEDIAVVGYDDLDIGTYFKPYLTTVHQPKENFAALACERLIDKICSCADEEIIHMVIEPRLIIRDSCGLKQE